MNDPERYQSRCHDDAGRDDQKICHLTRGASLSGWGGLPRLPRDLRLCLCWGRFHGDGRPEPFSQLMLKGIDAAPGFAGHTIHGKRALLFPTPDGALITMEEGRYLFPRV